MIGYLARGGIQYELLEYTEHSEQCLVVSHTLSTSIWGSQAADLVHRGSRRWACTKVDNHFYSTPIRFISAKHNRRKWPRCNAMSSESSRRPPQSGQSEQRSMGCYQHWLLLRDTQTGCSSAIHVSYRKLFDASQANNRLQPTYSLWLVQRGHNDLTNESVR